MAARQQAIDRVEDQIDRANVTQATVAFGVSMEKIMLLLGELRFNEMHERLFQSVRSGAKSREAVLNGKTMGLQSGKELPKSE